jgi:hypothetical protein
MCRRVECPTCGRPTFAGCGAHVEQVLGDVPPAERCRCKEAAAAAQRDGGASSDSRDDTGGLGARLRGLFSK